MSNDDATFEPWFVRLPPDEMELEEARANPMFVEVDKVVEGDPLLGLFLHLRAQEFENKQNPVLAFEAFRHCMEHGVYPPLGILRWIAEAFGNYLDEQGAKPLDHYFGTARGRGQRETAYEKLLLEQRNQARMMEMDCLIYLGATREQAAEMVSRKMEAEDWNHTHYDIKDLAASTLEELHKEHDSFVSDEESAQLIGLLNADKVSRFLKQFPEDSIAPSLRGNLK